MPEHTLILNHVLKSTGQYKPPAKEAPTEAIAIPVNTDPKTVIQKNKKKLNSTSKCYEPTTAKMMEPTMTQSEIAEFLGIKPENIKTPLRANYSLIVYTIENNILVGKPHNLTGDLPECLTEVSVHHIFASTSAVKIKLKNMLTLTEYVFINPIILKG